MVKLPSQSLTNDLMRNKALQSQSQSHRYIKQDVRVKVCRQLLIGQLNMHQNN